MHPVRPATSVRSSVALVVGASRAQGWFVHTVRCGWMDVGEGKVGEMDQTEPEQSSCSGRGVPKGQGPKPEPPRTTVSRIAFLGRHRRGSPVPFGQVPPLSWIVAGRHSLTASASFGSGRFPVSSERVQRATTKQWPNAIGEMTTPGQGT